MWKKLENCPFLRQRQVVHGTILTTSLAAFCLVALLAVFPMGCSDVTLNGPPPGAFLGRGGAYDYSPTSIQVGNVQQYWWCGQGHNPELPSQDTDTIQYVSLDLTSGVKSRPVTVLAETPGAWDSLYVCNPKVVGGVFTNPLGDGNTYTYAMYYVGTSKPWGGNDIGVAFSNDGVTWKKYPEPVLRSNTQAYYGVAQPSVYNSDKKSGIWMFYEDANDPSAGNRHILVTSTNGLQFTDAGVVTSKGLDQYLPESSWGDIAYDSAAGYWYALFHLPGSSGRPPETTGGVLERGQVGVVLFRIQKDALLTGTTPWQFLKSFDTNLTGNELNFLGGFVRDQYGTLNLPKYPSVQILTSISNPKPAWDSSPERAGNSAYPSTWDISLVQWTPGSTPIALNRYKNKSVHEVTTGWVDPAGGFNLESVVGHLYEAPEQGATVAIYGCKKGATEYFLSLDRNCGGALLLGLSGYGYPGPQPGKSLVPIFSCDTDHDHFASNDSSCEGQDAGSLLAYGLQ